MPVLQLENDKQMKRELLSMCALGSSSSTGRVKIERAELLTETLIAMVTNIASLLVVQACGSGGDCGSDSDSDGDRKLSGTSLGRGDNDCGSDDEQQRENIGGHKKGYTDIAKLAYQN
jgi:hypothetical protein